VRIDLQIKSGPSSEEITMMLRLTEVEKANLFSLEELPQVPDHTRRSPAGSVARRLAGLKQKNGV